MFLVSLYQIVELLANVLVMLIIVQFVIGLLFAFNAVSPSNDFLRSVYTGVNALLSPVLDPIRRFMPSTGAIDFSPIVLILALQILLIVLRGLILA